MAVSAMGSVIDRALQVRTILRKPNLDQGKAMTTSELEMAAGARVAFLRELLLKLDPDFVDERIDEVSKLSCATTKNGAYIWASPSEISKLEGHLTLRDEPAVVSSGQGFILPDPPANEPVTPRTDPEQGLRECTVQVRVINGHRMTGAFRSDKEIGEGEIDLAPYVTTDRNRSRPIMIDIPLAGSSVSHRSKCTITIDPKGPSAKAK
ncbi:hypothetical protein PHYBOEH_000245 [Phytophthora boehmeriae]|uniref:Uncharacterized protein n=1 Tax=Phytophthora boehmeriae TaxID=109152 RepID=A0A8T1VEV6_9STRA|nr:hypothetical protein PHYBOEH_000245 [Phytophthora boehmeriae]